MGKSLFIRSTDDKEKYIKETSAAVLSSIRAQMLDPKYFRKILDHSVTEDHLTAKNSVLKKIIRESNAYKIW